MSFADFNEFIQRDLLPDMVDTVIYRGLEPWIRTFGLATDRVKSGDRITSKYRMAYSSNAAFYGKGDTNPASSTQTLAKPYWDKVFSHGAAEVHGIDLSNDRPTGSQEVAIAEVVKKEVEALADLNVGAFYTQIKADVDETTAYSDKSLSRTTHTTLVSYEEVTNASITLAYMRNMIKGVTMNKNVKLSDYVCLMQGDVYYKFKPLAAAIHAWNVTGSAGQAVDMGFQDVANFEGLQILPPTEFINMTTGDVLMLRKQDVNIVPHRPLEIVAVESGRDSIKMVLRSGYNIYIDEPYKNGKMLLKD